MNTSSWSHRIYILLGDNELNKYQLVTSDKCWITVARTNKPQHFSPPDSRLGQMAHLIAPRASSSKIYNYFCNDLINACLPPPKLEGQDLFFPLKPQGPSSIPSFFLSPCIVCKPLPSAKSSAHKSPPQSGLLRPPCGTMSCQPLWPPPARIPSALRQRERSTTISHSPFHRGHSWEAAVHRLDLQAFLVSHRVIWLAHQWWRTEVEWVTSGQGSKDTEEPFPTLPSSVQWLDGNIQDMLEAMCPSPWMTAWGRATGSLPERDTHIQQKLAQLAPSHQSALSANVSKASPNTLQSFSGSSTDSAQSCDKLQSLLYIYLFTWILSVPTRMQASWGTKTLISLAHAVFPLPRIVPGT